MGSWSRNLLLLGLVALALGASAYLSRSYARGDVRRGVRAVRGHLEAACGGEAGLRRLIAERFGLARPRLTWRGRVVSDFYGVVEVDLVAEGSGGSRTFVWEMGLVSGDLAPRNEAAAALLRAAEALAQGDGPAAPAAPPATRSNP